MPQVPKGLFTFTFACTLLLAASAAGCTQSFQAASVQDQASASEIEIFMGEYFFQMEGRARGASVELEAGSKYEMEFINMGSEIHEVVIGRDLLMENGQPTGYRKSLLDGAKVEIEGTTVVGDKVRKFEVAAGGLEELELESGVILEIEFTVPTDKTGEWEMACFVPGHYQQGMHIPLLVKGQT